MSYTYKIIKFISTKEFKKEERAEVIYDTDLVRTHKGKKSKITATKHVRRKSKTDSWRDIMGNIYKS